MLHPLQRVGAGEFRRISWDDALDLVAENFLKCEQRHGAESVWPYYYAGTMGLVMRDGINRLRHAKKYSGFHSTICVNPAYAGFAAGTGKIAGSTCNSFCAQRPGECWSTTATACADWPSKLARTAHGGTSLAGSPARRNQMRRAFMLGHGGIVAFVRRAHSR